MPKRVIVAHSPEGKTTTVDIRVGEKGIPFGWEYIFCDKTEIPPGKLRDKWKQLSDGKRIHTSISNRERIPLSEISGKNKATKAHLDNLERRKQLKLSELDILWIRNQETSGHKHEETKEAIIAFKNALRSLEVDPNSFKTLDAFLKHTPTELTTNIDHYMKRRLHPIYKVGAFAIVLLFIVVPFLTAILEIYGVI